MQPTFGSVPLGRRNIYRVDQATNQAEFVNEYALKGAGWKTVQSSFGWVKGACIMLADRSNEGTITHD